MQKFFEIYKKQIIGGAALLFIALNIIVLSEMLVEKTAAEATIYFLNVGDGDAVFISMKGGQQILIDGGPDSKILAELGKITPFYNHFIDIVVLTKPDASHAGGLIDVLKRYNVGEIIEVGVDGKTTEYNEFEKLVEAKNIKDIVADKPFSISFSGVSILNFLTSSDDGAIVTEFNFEGKKILLMSGADRKIENKLLAEEAVGDVDVLKIGHNGSKTSATEAFLNIVKPEYVVVSVGAKNRFGYPSEEVLGRLSATGAKIFRTDLDGTIKLEIRGGQLIWK